MVVVFEHAVVGWVIDTVPEDKQLFASVTVALYAPATRLDAIAVLLPDDQVYAYGNVPPLAVTVVLPVPPLHEAFIFEIFDVNAAGSIILTLPVEVQPLTSVTVPV